jgi:type IV pilus assembly protein PilW
MRSARNQAGLSLIELMISITLGLMILSGVAFVFVNTSQARNEIERTSRQIENGRYAIELLTDDLALAGYYGELDVGALTAPGALPTDQCSISAVDWLAWIPLHIQGFDGGAGFSAATCALTNHKAGTDVLVIRRTRTCVAGTTGCDSVVAGNPYVQVSLCSTEATLNKIGVEGTETFDLKQNDCTNVAVKRQYYVHIYYISTDNGSGANVPTLKRIALEGTSWTTTPLVEGIEQMNLVYGVDSTVAPGPDGSPDTYTAAPANITEWLNVVSVQIYLLARNLETSPDYTDGKTYNLGIDSLGAALNVTPADNYRRHIYSSVVRLNNPAGRKDTP